MHPHEASPRRPLALVSAVVALAAGLLAGCGDGEGEGKLEGKVIDVFDSAQNLSFGFGHLWVATGSDLVKVDPKTNKAETVAENLSGGPVAAGEGAVWVGDVSNGRVIRINPRDGARVGRPTPIADTFPTGNKIDAITTGAGAVWVAFGNSVVALDPRTGRRLGRPITVGGFVDEMVVSGTGVWVLIGIGFDRGPPDQPGGAPDDVSRSERDDMLVRLDARTRRVVLRKPKTGPSVSDIAVGEGLLWTMDSSSGRINRLDPATGHEAGKPLTESGTYLAVGDGSVWVTDPRTNEVKCVDVRSGRRVGDPEKIPDPEGNFSDVGAVVSGGGSAWIGSEVDRVVGRIQR